MLYFDHSKVSLLKQTKQQWKNFGASKALFLDTTFFCLFTRQFKVEKCLTWDYWTYLNKTLIRVYRIVRRI